MTTKNFFKILIIASFVFLMSVMQVFAVTPTVNTIPVNAAPVLLASVNIQNAKIISQKENVFNISFSLSNGVGLQTGVKYGVKLVSESQTGQLTVDEKIYDESLTLNPNTITEKEIVYTAPTYLEGPYMLVLTSNNTSGFPFGIINVGKVTLKSTTSGILILPETCSLQVVGEKNSPTYKLDQGVDIKAEENLKINCTAINSSKVAVSATPSYETRYRSSYGDIVATTGGDVSPISFKAGEKKSFAVVLPKANISQAYNIEFSLNNKDIKSNTVSVQYLMSGFNATIQNVSLNKDYYERGEKAQVSYFYSSSSGSLVGNRVAPVSMPTIISKLQILNGDGKSCARTKKETLSVQASHKIETPISINSQCIDPKIILTLIDDKGTVLDQKEFKVKTTSSIPKSNTNTSTQSKYIIIILVLLCIAAVYIYIKRKDTPPTTPTETEPKPTDSNIPLGIIFFFLLLGLFGFVPAGKVSANTYTILHDSTYYPRSDIILDINVESYYRITNIGNNVTLGITASMNETSAGNAKVYGIVDYTISDLAAGTQSIETKVYRAYSYGVQTSSLGTGSPTATVAGNYRLYFDIAYVGVWPNNPGGLGFSHLQHHVATNANLSNGSWGYFYDLAGNDCLIGPCIPDHTYSLGSNNYKFPDASNGITYDLHGATLLTTYAQIDTQVRDPLTVTVYANDQTDPVTPVTSGSNVAVKWKQTGAVSCACTCINKSTSALVSCGTAGTTSCGSGIGVSGDFQKSTPYPIPGVTKETTFKVHCD